ncbi:hypothetical protein ACB092_06G034700 [Castanea dentata]
MYDELTTDDVQWDAQLQAYERSRFGGKINPSLLDLKHLIYLDLSFQFYSNSQIPRFSHLEFLNLGYNSLHATISSSIGNLTSAISIDLSRNELEGKVPRSLGNLCNLREIRLSYNKWSPEISEIFESLSGCVSNSLEILDLSNAQLSGQLTIELGQFKNLVILSLGYNSISGPIPLSIGNLSSLRSLNLESNQINGTSTQNFGQLSKLWYLNICLNMLEGVVLEVHFANFMRLKTLVASQNQLTLKASDNWTPPFQLNHLDLGSWNLGPKFPLWLCSEKQLSTLGISNTGIIDAGPPSFWNLTSQLNYLNISHNQIYGEIPRIPLIFSTASIIDMSSNHFTGPLPTSIGSLINLRSLHLYNNSFSGKFPSLLKNCKYLFTIDIGKNDLMILNLRFNNFHGQIPKELCALTSLQILDLSHNKLFGRIPKCVNNFSTMARNNNSNSPLFLLGWSIGSSFIPFESELLLIKGKALEYSTTLRLVNIIDLSNNNLSREIPKEVASLQGLQSLNLSFNILTGRIPENIGDMRSLESIDLSINQLSGQIPQSMSCLTFLSNLNLSNNNLTGKIPSSTQLQSLNASSFFGNGLYVKPNTGNKRSEDFRALEVDWFYVSMALGFIVGFWVVLGPLLLKKQRRIVYFQFIDRLGYKLCGVVAQTW